MLFIQQMLYNQQLTMVAPTKGEILIIMVNNTGKIKNTIKPNKHQWQKEIQLKAPLLHPEPILSLHGMNGTFC
jgi:hypothetical protein